MAGMRQLRAEMRREEKRAEAADPVTAKQLARAEKLGREGFATGKQAPTQDAKIVAMCQKRPHHVWMALMKAWNEGWQKAHITKSDNELQKAGWFNEKEGRGSRKPKKTTKSKATKKKVSKAMTKQRPKVRDKVKLLGKWGHITEVRKDDVRIKDDGVSGGATLVYTDMLHKVAYRPDPIAKMSFYWLVKFPRRTTKQRSATKPKPRVKKTATTPKLTATQKKRLKATGSVTIKRGGKFVVVRG